MATEIELGPTLTLEDVIELCFLHKLSVVLHPPTREEETTWIVWLYEKENPGNLLTTEGELPQAALMAAFREWIESRPSVDT
jgi:hypothetical protein